MMNHLKKTQPPIRIPPEVVSYNDNSYDLSLMLSYLDNNLTILEETPLTPEQFDYMAYAQARCFLKVCYLLLRILLDDVSGIIKYFYNQNEPTIEVKKSFDDLLGKAKNGKLPEDLRELLACQIKWFPEMRQRRVNLEHYYLYCLILLKLCKSFIRLPFQGNGPQGKEKSWSEDLKYKNTRFFRKPR